MTEWRNYQIYYTDLDLLITECVYPFLRSLQPKPEKCFFERHYAGGAHLRVRFKTQAGRAAEIAAALVDKANQFLRSTPSKPAANYSPDRARRLMEIQDEPPEPDEALAYRVNVILEQPYQRLRSRLASREAADLLEDYLGDCMPLLDQILRSSTPKTTELLRLFFLRSLFIAGDFPAGSVSYRAHWEGFAAGFSCRPQVDSIRAAYEQDRGRVRELLLAVKQSFDTGRYCDDVVLSRWHEILGAYWKRTEETLAAGSHITRQPNLAEARDAKRRVLGSMREDSPFLRAVLQDERFLASFAFDANLTCPRVLTNLLYILVSSAGLNMMARMRLCYYTFRAVEEEYSCDLKSILELTAARTIQRNLPNLMADSHDHGNGSGS